MTTKEAIRLFEKRKVRAMWSDEDEKWYFSVVDAVSALRPPRLLAQAKAAPKKRGE